MKTLGSRWIFVDFPVSLEQFPLETELTDAETLRHLHTVLRLTPGETLTLVDAERGRAYQGVILEIGRNAARIRLEKYDPESDTSPPESACTLAVSLIKEQRWDWLVQKATELGARIIQPLLTERSVVRLSEADYAKKCARWRQVARSSAEQCENRFIPKIPPPMPVGTYVRTLSHSEGFKCLLKERGADRLPLKHGLSGLDTGQAVIFAIGPEGGWTDKELLLFEQAGFQPYSLGSRILRSETAAIAAIAALTYENTKN